MAMGAAIQAQELRSKHGLGPTGSTELATYSLLNVISMVLSRVTVLKGILPKVQDKYNIIHFSQP